MPHISIGNPRHRPLPATGTDSACDVLVIGGGIAGTMAALAAARAGARTVLACAGKLFSGSSFYPGTWGLGLVGPENESDEAELAGTICAIGGGAADPALVRSFVAGIRPTIAELEGLDVELMRPDHADERELIPCFDHKHRLWRGITRANYENAVGAALKAAGARVREHRELMDLVEQHTPDVQADAAAPCNAAPLPARRAGRGEPLPAAGATFFSPTDAARNAAGARRTTGALLYNRNAQRFERVRAGAVVLATGGYGGLFARRLTASDVIGTAQAVAAAHGCALVNLEFMQIMPAFVAPKRAYGTVFNEKTWRYAQLVDDAGNDLLAQPAAAESLAEQELLELRSGHGPFTSRLASRAVDLAIETSGPAGAVVRYPGGLEGALPEFVQTYFSWLEREKGVRPTDELRIAEFAHAANGGIRINAHAETDLPGLYACGECTGGMHGADRLGGLSSANGLVFGLRAGRNAAAWARDAGRAEQSEATFETVRADGPAEDAKPPHGHRGSLDETAAASARADLQGITETLQHTMTAHCMVTRTTAGLAEAARTIERLAEQLEKTAPPELPRIASLTMDGVASGALASLAPREAALLARLRRAQLQLDLAHCIVAAAQARTQSCGSHYRA